MTNDLSLVVYKLNLDYIFKNYLKKEMWKKEWVIFNDGGLKIVVRLDTINVARGNISLQIKAVSQFDWNYAYQTIPLDSDHRNLEVIENGIYSDTLRLIEMDERVRIKDGEKYRLATLLDEAQADMYRQEAVDFLDEEEVSNEDIREAYIDKYINDRPSDVWREKVVSENMYLTNPAAYLMFALWVGSDKLYQTYKRRIEYANDSIIDDEEFIEKYEELVGKYELKTM